MVDLVAEGFKVEVSFWGHAARELREAAVNFISLDPKHANLYEGGGKVRVTSPQSGIATPVCHPLKCACYVEPHANQWLAHAVHV